MTPDKRRVAHLGASVDELNECFAALINFFKLDWLENKSAEHRLQQLWQRKDALATNELFTFGKALVIVQAIDRKWLEQQVRQVLQPDENNQNGALFEIMCVSMMASAGMHIQPAPQSQKGYDATVVFANGKQAKISMKNYRMSSHEKDFHQKCRQLRTKALSAFKPKIPAAKFFISFPAYPFQNDWDTAWNSFSEMARRNERGIKVQPNQMMAGVMPLLGDDPQGAKLSGSYFSDSFLAICHVHQNEQKNFVDKLLKAAADMKKHVGREVGQINVLFIRLHPSAQMNLLEEAAKELLGQREEICLDMIFLHQAYVARENDQSSIVYTVRVAMSPSLELAGEQFKLVVPVGKISVETWKFELQGIDSVPVRFDDDVYIHQAGDQYYDMVENGSSWEGNLRNPASGVHTHSVWNGVLLSGLHPPGDELLIL